MYEIAYDTLVVVSACGTIALTMTLLVTLTRRWCCHTSSRSMECKYLPFSTTVRIGAATAVTTRYRTRHVNLQARRKPNWRTVASKFPASTLCNFATSGANGGSDGGQSGGDDAYDALDTDTLRQLLSSSGLDPSLIVDDEFEFWDEEVDMDADTEALTSRAVTQSSLLPAATPLAAHTGSHDEACDILSQRGVVRLNQVLTPQIATRLRACILDEATAVERLCDSDPESHHHQRLMSAVLSPGDPNLITRLDLRMPMEPPVLEALNVLVSSSIGDVMMRKVGPDAQLWELAAIISRPGSLPQIIHSDTEYSDEPCLYTAFVALQNVSPEMGPTLFLGGTHTLDHHAKYAEGRNQEKYLPRTRPEVGLLGLGDCSLYDGRLLHAGGANSTEETRVLFYVTFRHPDSNGRDLGNENAWSLRPEYRGKHTLGSLLSGALK